MTLDLGPGRNVQPHRSKPVIRYDHRAVGVQVVGDVRRLPFRSGVFDVVYASHVLEHFHYRETDSLLAEWVRVIKPFGELQLFVPNLEWVALQVQAGICDEFVLHALFGRQEYDSDVHRTGFTPAILAERLDKLKALRCEIRTFRNSICVWARKVNHLDAECFNSYNHISESEALAESAGEYRVGRETRH